MERVEIKIVITGDKLNVQAKQTTEDGRADGGDASAAMPIDKPERDECCRTCEPYGGGGKRPPFFFPYSTKDDGDGGDDEFIRGTP